MQYIMQISQNNHAKVYKRNKIFYFYESIILDGTNKSQNNFCKKLSNNATKANKNNLKSY